MTKSVSDRFARWDFSLHIHYYWYIYTDIIITIILSVLLGNILMTNYWSYWFLSIFFWDFGLYRAPQASHEVEQMVKDAFANISIWVLIKAAETLPTKHKVWQRYVTNMIIDGSSIGPLVAIKDSSIYKGPLLAMNGVITPIEVGLING